MTRTQAELLCREFTARYPAGTVLVPKYEGLREFVVLNARVWQWMGHVTPALVIQSVRCPTYVRTLKLGDILSIGGVAYDCPYEYTCDGLQPKRGHAGYRAVTIGPRQNGGT
jgi:hypothetical protein